MKHSLLFIILGALACGSFGCQSGEVDVSGVPQAGPQLSAESAKNRSSNLAKPTVIPEILFAVASDAQNPALEGVGFLSSESKLTDAFEIQWSERGVGIDKRVYAAAGKSLFRPENASRSVLATGLATLGDTLLLRTESTVSSLDVSPSGGRVAWTTENGAARIDSVALPTPVRETAEEIRFGNSEDEVFVSTPSQTTLIFHRGSGNTWNLTQTLQGIEAAPSASEDRLAFISTNRHTYGQLVVVDRKTGRSLLHQTFSGQATSARVAHEPAWSGDGTIAYWVDQDVSHAEMRILDLATEQEHAVPFELGPGARHNVICPMWAGDALYFAQWTQAGYSIARLPGATADRPLPFAVPRANGSHYICPITARGAGL